MASRIVVDDDVIKAETGEEVPGTSYRIVIGDNRARFIDLAAPTYEKYVLPLQQILDKYGRDAPPGHDPAGLRTMPQRRDEERVKCDERAGGCGRDYADQKYTLKHAVTEHGEDVYQAMVHLLCPPHMKGERCPHCSLILENAAGLFHHTKACPILKKTEQSATAAL